MAGLEFIYDAISELKSKGDFRLPRILDGAQAPTATYDDKEVINFCSTNYLGFANHPMLKEKTKEAIDKYGVGTGSVRTFAGNMHLHQVLEEKLAEFKRVEKTILFQSGFNANIGTLATILGPEDIVVSDAHNHASIIDGCQLSDAKRKIFNHGDINHAQQLLKEARSENPGKIVLCTDGVFCVDGDIAQLPELVKLAKENNAIIMVNDAHALGIIGRDGRGTVDHYNLHGHVDIQVGSLSMSFAALGGYVAGPEVLIDYLMQRAKPVIFSASLPPSVITTALGAMELIQADNSFLQKLWENSRYFREGLKQLDFDTGRSQTPIIPIMIGEERKTIKFSDRLFTEGVFAQCAVYPTVPKELARLRIVVTAGHKKEELNKALDIFEKVGKDLAII